MVVSFKSYNGRRRSPAACTFCGQVRHKRACFSLLEAAARAAKGDALCETATEKAKAVCPSPSTSKPDRT